VAPPLVKGRALARRRVAGVVFLVVIALLVELAVALYQKKFTDTVDVSLQTDRVGNQLTVHADVKMHGVIVGEVRKIRSTGTGATLSLALKTERAALVPRNAVAQLLPKTLFGEKEVTLSAPASGADEPIREGDVITQDRTTTALETEKALDDTLPLLKSLNPQQLSLALNAISEGLRDRGDKLGSNLALNAKYLAQLNPSLATLGQDNKGLADLANNTADAAPDFLRAFDNLSYSSRSLVEEKAALDGFLSRTSAFAASARSLVAQNEQRFVDLARDSRPSLEMYAHYSPGYACLLNRIAFSEIEGERVFGGGQPGLHITVEVIKDNGPFVTGDEPKNKETRQFGCFGLGPKPIRPYPAFANPQDGYRDSDPAENPGQGPGGCCQAQWFGQAVLVPTSTVVGRRSMPSGTTQLEALLLAPLGAA
jgi:virulence factor Mce-like protein